MERHQIYIKELISEKKELWCECSRLQVEKVEAEKTSIQYLKKGHPCVHDAEGVELKLTEDLGHRRIAEAVKGGEVVLFSIEDITVLL